MVRVAELMKGVERFRVISALISTHYLGVPEKPANYER